MRRIVMALILVLLVSCTIELPTQDVTETPTATVTDVPATETPTNVPTPTNTPVPVIVQVPMDISNGDFESAWHDEPGGQVGDGWHLWSCDGCDTPYGRTRHPEWKMTQLPSRVHSGFQAEQFFNTYSPGRGGLYQDVLLPDNALECTFSAWVHAWSANEWSRIEDPDVDGDFLERRYAGYARIGINPPGSNTLFQYADRPFTSDIVNDDVKNLTFRLGAASRTADPKGEVAWSGYFGYALVNGQAVIYDNWTLISYTFTPTEEMQQDGFFKLIIESVNIYGFVHSDRYVDDVQGSCIVEGGQAPVPTQTPAPSQHEFCETFPCYVSTDSIKYKVLKGVNIRSKIGSSPLDVIGGYAAGDTVEVQCIIVMDEEASVEWASTQTCDPPILVYFLIHTEDDRWLSPEEQAEG